MSCVFIQHATYEEMEHILFSINNKLIFSSLHMVGPQWDSINTNHLRITKLITQSNTKSSVGMYVGAVVVARGLTLLSNSHPWGKEGPISCVFMSLCLQANQPDWTREGKEGVTWQNHSYYEIVGLHFNSTWPCQGHHMPACLPACMSARLTGDPELLDKSSCSTKTHPAIIFSGNIPSDDPYRG